jgi:cell division protein FtsI (penicillin-binding protein 3)
VIATLPPDERAARRRLAVVLVVLAVLAGLPLLRLVQLQADGESLAAAGRSQRQDEVDVPAQRGSVLDRNGVQLATSVPRQVVAVDKQALMSQGVDDRVELETFAGRLAPLLGVDAGTVRQRLLQAADTSRWVKVADAAEQRAAEGAVRVLADEGITAVLDLSPTSVRVYPGGESALRVIGTVGPEGPGPRAGVERLYDDVLRGEAGRIVVEQGPRGRTMPGAVRVVEPPAAGSDVQLTLDRTLQYEAERILAAGAAEASARGGVALVGRPGTGELLAVAGVERNEETGEMDLASAPLAFSAAYQAGSVFKLVTVAAGYEAGVIDDATTFDVGDRITVTDRTFTDHEPHGGRRMTVDQIVADSSNVGTIKIAQLLGRERLHAALGEFGFGRTTGVGSPAESPGVLPDVERWRPADTAAAAIGTFQAATPVQLWAAYNVVANRGRYVPPRLVDATVDSDGTRRPVPRGEDRQVVSPETAARVHRALRAVVEQGTGKRWDLPGYPVAAKTGTGRMPSPTKVDAKDSYVWPDGRYHYVTTFTGYLPADRPQVAITVMLLDTPPGTTGGTVAGPIFAELARLSIRELAIVPTGGAAQTAPGEPVRAVPAGRTSTAAAAPSTTMAGERGAVSARPRATGGTGASGQRRVDDGG